jgi:hypothetical protein
MLCREIVAACSQIHTKHINTLCEQNVQLLNVKLAVQSNHWAINGKYSGAICTVPLLYPRSVNIRMSGDCSSVQNGLVDIAMELVDVCGPVYLNRYSDALRPGRSGDRILLGGPDFPHPSRPALRPTQPPIQCKPGLSTGGKALTTQPPSSADVKERVELYLCSLWAFMTCSRANRIEAVVNVLLLVIRARSQGSGCTAAIRLIVHPVF